MLTIILHHELCDVPLQSFFRVVKRQEAPPTLNCSVHCITAACSINSPVRASTTPSYPLLQRSLWLKPDLLQRSKKSHIMLQPSQPTLWQWSSQKGYRKCLLRRPPTSSRGCLGLDTCWRTAGTTGHSSAYYSVFLYLVTNARPGISFLCLYMVLANVTCHNFEECNYSRWFKCVWSK